MAGTLVTVGLPVHNGERYLAAALDAIVAQDHEPLEVIVCDNASTDATAEIARDYAARDRRIRVQEAAENRGAAWNFNRALALAHGEYFKWAAHDDVMAPSFVRVCAGALDADPSAVLCYPKTVLIDESGTVVGPFEDDLALLDDRPHRRLATLLAEAPEYHPIFGVIRTEALRATGGIGGYVGSDIITLAALAMAGRFLEHPERLFLRRFHETTSVNANPDARDRARWFRAGARRSVVLPTTRLTGELLRAVARARLEPSEKLRCFAEVAHSWAAPRWRDMGGEVKQAVRGAGASRLPAARGRR